MKQETDRLQELDGRTFLPRLAGYMRYMGPGYMQSAMTLGGGSAFAAIFAGAAFGYQLLWVAPLAMLLGIIMLSAVAWITLSTGRDPYDALKEHVHPVFAWAFAWGGLITSIIWQFAQYALASAMLVLLARQIGIESPQWAMGLVALAWCVVVGMLYGARPRLLQLYESILKWMVWFIIACFAIVVIRSGLPDPGAFALGFVPSIPGEVKGVTGLGLVVSGMAAAVGANMLFVYPYTLLSNGWGRGHRRLARYDLVFGMFIPFSIAVTLMVIASASVFHYGDPDLFTGRKISPASAAELFADPSRLGNVIGIWFFGLGIIAMALSSITMQMIAAGFAGVKLFGLRQHGSGHKFFMLLPAIGVLGAVFWTNMAMWVPVPTNVICGFLLPLSVVGFIVLLRRRRMLGDDTPRGALGNWWTIGMCTGVVVLVVFLSMFVVQKVPGFIEKLSPAPAQVQIEP